MIRQPFQPLQAREQGQCAIYRVINKLGPADIADHQSMAGQHEPRLLRPRAIGHQETDMLRRVTGCVYDVDHDIAERQAIAVLHGMERERHFGAGVEHVFGTDLAGKRTPGGTMIGMDMGIDDKADAHAGVIGYPQIWRDVAHRIDDSTGRVSAAAEQVLDRHGLGVEKLTQDHIGLPQSATISFLDRQHKFNQSRD